MTIKQKKLTVTIKTKVMITLDTYNVIILYYYIQCTVTHIHCVLCTGNTIIILCIMYNKQYYTHCTHLALRESPVQTGAAAQYFTALLD